MKKVFFGSAPTTGGPEPFWKPWGAAGWLLRLLAFLVLLFVLLLLLSLFKNKKSPSRADIEPSEIPNAIVNPDTPTPPHVPVPDEVNFPHDIQNPGPNLPSPGDNNLPPFGDDDIVTDDGQQIVGDRLNVILDSSADDQTFNQWANEFKALYPGNEYKVVYYDNLTKTLQIQVPSNERNQIMQALPRQITDISFIVFHEGLMDFHAGYHPNDPVFLYPETAWYFAPIQTYEAWEITKGSPNITVAVCDSYFDLNHDDLNSNRIVKPFSVPTRSANVAPPSSGCGEVPFMHGSMVASQAIGNMDNQRGTCGIAPLCKFMPVSLGGQPTCLTVIQGLLYAIYQGADVVNLSLGFLPGEALADLSISQQIALSQQIGLQDERVWNFVADLANERNVTIVWAAGNEHTYLAIDPSKRGDRSIKVSAVDTDLHQATFTNFGNVPQYDVNESTISAPGVNILGAKPFNSYDIGPGTSFAAPIVTGAVALMKSLDPTLSTAEIIEILQATGKPVENAPTIGKLLQIRDALLMVKGNYADFNDIISDHNKFLGLWMSTELQPIFINGQPTDKKCRNYYEVRTTSSGRSIVYAADTRHDYTTTFTIEWKPDRIILKEAGELRSPADPNGHVFIPSTIVCTPDSANLLKCEATTSSGHHESYYLRKVTQRQEQPLN
jgi:subtilisin family serine protease